MLKTTVCKWATADGSIVSSMNTYGSLAGQLAAQGPQAGDSFFRKTAYHFYKDVWSSVYDAQKLIACGRSDEVDKGRLFVRTADSQSCQTQPRSASETREDFLSEDEWGEFVAAPSICSHRDSTIFGGTSSKPDGDSQDNAIKRRQPPACRRLFTTSSGSSSPSPPSTPVACDMGLPAAANRQESTSFFPCSASVHDTHRGLTAALSELSTWCELVPDGGALAAKPPAAHGTAPPNSSLTSLAPPGLPPIRSTPFGSKPVRASAVRYPSGNGDCDSSERPLLMGSPPARRVSLAEDPAPPTSRAELPAAASPSRRSLMCAKSMNRRLYDKLCTANSEPSSEPAAPAQLPSSGPLAGPRFCSESEGGIAEALPAEKHACCVVPISRGALVMLHHVQGLLSAFLEQLASDRTRLADGRLPAQSPARVVAVVKKRGLLSEGCRSADRRLPMQQQQQQPAVARAAATAAAAAGGGGDGGRSVPVAQSVKTPPPQQVSGISRASRLPPQAPPGAPASEGRLAGMGAPPSPSVHTTAAMTMGRPDDRRAQYRRTTSGLGEPFSSLPLPLPPVKSSLGTASPGALLGLGAGAGLTPLKAYRSSLPAEATPLPASRQPSNLGRRYSDAGNSVVGSPVVTPRCRMTFDGRESAAWDGRYGGRGGSCAGGGGEQGSGSNSALTGQPSRPAFARFSSLRRLPWEAREEEGDKLQEGIPIAAVMRDECRVALQAALSGRSGW